MGTTTILGDTYSTVIMPDGKEWMAENLRWITIGIGNWWKWNPSNDGDGIYYKTSDIDVIIAALAASGWRIPTYSDMQALASAVNGPHGLRSVVSTSAKWVTNAYATNTTGFSLEPSGRYDSSYPAWRAPKWYSGDPDGVQSSPIHEFYHRLNPSNPPPYDTGYTVTQINQDGSGDFPDTFGLGGYPVPSANKYSVRLVRDVVTHGFPDCDFGVGPEWGYEPKITPSLTWTQTASGLWRCLDDGAAFDAYDAEITVKVTTSALAAWEAFIVANRGAETTYTAPAGVRPFGPHIDCSSGVQVVIGDAWKEEGRVGIKADCWTLHIPMRYVGGYTPTNASDPAILGKKYPTPTWYYPTKVHATEAGGATAAPRAAETQTTQIIVDNLDQTAAEAFANWCLYQRGTSFAYSPAAGAYPFGPAAGDGPFTVRLIGWTCQKPRPNRWDMTVDLAREG